MKILIGKGYKRFVLKLAKIFAIPRSSLYYTPQRDEEDQALAARIRALAMEDVTAGYRTIHRRLLDEGFQVSLAKVYRIYRELGLAIGSALQGRRRKRKEKKEEVELSRGRFVHDVWAIDFTVLKVGNRQVRVLVVVDEYSRKVLDAVVSVSFGGYRTVEILRGLIQRYGPPRRIRSDAGPEFRSRKFAKLLKSYRIQHEYRVGSPWYNGVVERTIRTMKEEAGEEFGGFLEAVRRVEGWMERYNRIRKHSALNHRTPEEVFNAGLAEVA